MKRLAQMLGLSQEGYSPDHSGELSYLRMENTRLLGIIEMLAEKRPAPIVRAPQTPDAGAPVRAGRAIVSRGEAKGMAVSELYKRHEAEKP